MRSGSKLTGGRDNVICFAGDFSSHCSQANTLVCRVQSLAQMTIYTQLNAQFQVAHISHPCLITHKIITPSSQCIKQEQLYHHSNLYFIAASIQLHQDREKYLR